MQFSHSASFPNLFDTTATNHAPTMTSHSTSSTTSSAPISQHLISGVWILFVTSLTRYFHSLMQKLMGFFSNSVWTSVTITNQDAAYEWIMKFLQNSSSESFSSSISSDMASSRRNQRTNVKIKVDDLEKLERKYGVSPAGDESVDSKGDSLEDFLDQELGDGSHWIRYAYREDDSPSPPVGSATSSQQQNTTTPSTSTTLMDTVSEKINKKSIWMHIHVSSSDKLSTRGWDKEPFQMQTLTITVYGRSSITEKVLTQFIEEAKQYYTNQNFAQNAKIYVVSKWSSWMQCGTKKPKRPMDSVVLDRNLSDYLLNDAREFLNQKQWYMDHGIPYRRGYCLYGPPGSGKSSFAIALASELSLGICVLTLSSNNLDDQSLNRLLHNTPSNCIILLEDIDAVFVAREATDMMESNRVTFSGLLNALDGVAAQEDKIFIMTTNHIEKLDPALLRPGRCDVKIRFNHASKKQIRQMFLRFNPNCGEELVLQFVDSVPEYTVSCSSLQEHFLKYENAKEAVQHFHELLRDPKREREDLYDENWKDASLRGIGEWLLRLGIPQYTAAFHAQGYYNLDDIREFDDDIVCSVHDEVPEGHMTRIESMLKGENHVKRNFQLAPRWRVLELFETYYGECSVPESVLSQLAGRMSSFQLMEHFEKYPNGAQEAMDHLNDILKPHFSWDMTEEDCEAIYKRESVLHFLKEIPLLEEADVSMLHEKLSAEEIHSTDELVDLSAGFASDYGIKEKGKILEIDFALNSLQKKHKKLKEQQEIREVSME